MTRDEIITIMRERDEARRELERIGQLAQRLREENERLRELVARTPATVLPVTLRTSLGVGV